MSLIDFLPPDAESFDPTANIAFSGNNTHAGSETFNSQFALGSQAFSATGTIQGGGGSVVTFTGSTASQTLSLPAAPTTDRLFLIRNEATVSVTLSGNGMNLDGGASVTVPIAGCGIIWFDGSAWWSLGPSSWLANNWQSTNGFNGVVNLNGLTQVTSRLALSSQAASASTFTVSATAGLYVASSYSPSGAQTITLPSTPTSSQLIWIADEGLSAATNNITVSGNGNGKSIGSASSITLAKNGAAVQLRFNGTAWFIVAAYNYP